LSAIFGHHFVETRKLSVRHATAFFETFDDIVLNAAEQSDVLSEHTDVICAGAAGEKRCVLCRQ